jgi:BASS family bile acid:Na+ symporter
MIFIPFILGMMFPAAHSLNFLLRWILIGMLYLVFLQLDPHQLKPRKLHWQLLLANILMGVVPCALLFLFGAPQLALAAFFIGIAPTANAAPVIMNFLRGRAGFVVTSFVITNLGVALALPLLLPLITGNSSFAFIWEIFKVLLLVIGLPICAAAVTRRIYPKSKSWHGKCRNISFSAWSLMLFIIAAGASHFFRSNPDVPKLLVLEIAVLSLVICAINFTLGRIMGGLKYGREASQSLGQKNTSFIIFVAITFANPLAALGPIFYVLWHNSWNAIQLYRCDRRRLRKMLKS